MRQPSPLAGKHRMHAQGKRYTCLRETDFEERFVNPVLIIPTYWSDGTSQGPGTGITVYDHVSNLSSGGELARCLNSLGNITNICRIMLLVAATPGAEEQAREKVWDIAARFGDFDILVIGQPEIDALHKRLDQFGFGDRRDAVALTSYGAIRNAGLLIAAALGHTEVLFIDDDELIDDRDFIEKGLFGLGKLTRRGIPVLVKTGFYFNRRSRYTAGYRKQWYNIAWKQDELFDTWMEQAMGGARIKPSQVACGGCLAIHREAWRRVAFDPWIARGEDLDFLLNMRMFGFDVWLDREWSLRHHPPQSENETARFRANIYRWIYEQHKISYARTQGDLLPIDPDKLMPYPGAMLKMQISRKLHTTALVRSMGMSERSGYLQAMSSCKDAERYAQRTCGRFFPFLYAWPELVQAVEGDEQLAASYLERIAELHAASQQVISLEQEAEEGDEEDVESSEEILARWVQRAQQGGRRRRHSAEDGDVGPGRSPVGESVIVRPGGDDAQGPD